MGSCRWDYLEQVTDIAELLTLLQAGPVVLLAPNGKEYLVAEVYDFGQEAAQLRARVAVQSFLDERHSH